MDKWIISRLNELVNDVTEGMENYELDRATRPISLFIDDLSTWYLRRSRDRFKGSDKEDKIEALKTTKYVLGEFSKVIAPFMPFFAEYLYLEVTGGTDNESVHLEKWPKGGKVDKNIIDNMQNVRDVVSLGLEARDVAQIKVRQPLAKLSIKKKGDELEDSLLELVMDEINVKEVVYEEIEENVMLDTTLTSELKEEGDYRDLLRKVQELRKKAGLDPQDIVVIKISVDANGKKIVEKFEEDLKSVAGIKEIIFEDNIEDSSEITIGDSVFNILLKK